ncbi:MAG: hypothetical protein ACSHXI_16885 [Hoeflea sp.]|uniref:hypothetical protein n=1 Tax=Hoeflea sp. TaxID=1940281 RepID=UPI003EFA40B8
MRKSDPTTTGNVIAFPRQQRKHSAATTARPQETLTRTPKRRQSKSSSEFRPSLHASTANDVLHRHRRRIEILTNKGNPTPELIDEIAPGLVRKILRRAGTGDTGKAELPKHLKRRLDLLCRFKHPAGLILKDWLDGNRRFLPANLQTIADHSTCAREEK